MACPYFTSVQDKSFTIALTDTEPGRRLGRDKMTRTTAPPCCPTLPCREASEVARPSTEVDGSLSALGGAFDETVHVENCCICSGDERRSSAGEGGLSHSVWQHKRIN